MMIQTKPRVAIIIVTYNSERNVPKLFKTLSAQSYTGDVRIIVVDNNSQDATIQSIKTNHKNIHLIQLQKNTGFAGGVNVGIDEAMRKDADAVIILNDDTFVANDFLEKLIEGAYIKDDIATAQALLLLAKSPEIINTAGNRMHYLGFGYGDKYKEHISTIEQDTVFDCTYASGAALLIKIEAIIKYGKLIKDYFMYHEDLEYGIRMLLAGRRNVVVTNAHVYHNYSFRKSILKFYFMERNRHRFMLSHFTVRTLLLLLPIYIVTEIALFGASIFSHTMRDRLHVCAYFFKLSTWRKIIDERKMIKSIRRVPDSRLVPYLSDGVYFQDNDTWFSRSIANPLWKVYWVFIKRFI